MFTVTGKLGAHDVSVTWDDGHLTGDPSAVRIVEMLASRYEGLPVGRFPEPTTTQRHLANPFSARTLIEAALTSRVDVSGDVPTLPRRKLPPGTVE